MSTQQRSQVDVLLVGYDNQENLGLRSILSYLHSRGYQAALVAFGNSCDSNILTVVQSYQPRLVAFSVIFQYSVEEFSKLMGLLRKSGVKAHFTAGGHFPTLAPRETLDLLPDLDSVVRFEGEEVIAELLEHLDSPQQWERIGSIAFRRGAEIVLTSPRPLISDLDSLPPVVRDVAPRITSLGIPMASMLASRGCPFNCSFCTIRQFYGGAPGELRRLRSPQAVVEEMNRLFIDKGVQLFVFQDDDFPIRTLHQEWLQAFLKKLTDMGLANRIAWKISCRVDDLDRESLEAMLSHGLVAVYLGVESGNETGLRTLNKQVNVAKNLAAINLLKKYDIAMAAGFMLFDPSSNIETVRENLEFLREVGADGFYPINFCKMLPYIGTPIEAKLRQSGRLKGTISQPDYDFIDPQLDWYAFLVQQIFAQRNFSSNGLQVCLQEANFNERLVRAVGRDRKSEDYRTPLKRLISRANILCLDTLENLLDELVTYGIDTLIAEQKTLLKISEREWQGEAEIELELAALDKKGKGNNLGLREFLENKIALEQEFLTPPPIYAESK